MLDTLDHLNILWNFCQNTGHLSLILFYFLPLFCICACMLGVILHEEHIELLTEDFKALKKVVEGKKLQEGSLHFTGKIQVCVSLPCIVSFKQRLLVSCRLVCYKLNLIYIAPWCWAIWQNTIWIILYHNDILYTNPVYVIQDARALCCLFLF